MRAPSFVDAKAVYFDVDDTLYDFEASMGHAFAHLHKAFPDHFAQVEVDRIADAYWTHYKAFPEPAKVDLINRDPDLFRRTMWAGALAALGLDAHPDRLARAVTDEMQRMRPQHWRAAMYPGARSLLLDLKARGRVMGAITNGPSPVQRPKLEALQYRDFFSEARVFVSGEFGARKPDPAIFLAAAKAADAEPRECVMVGDAREFDMPAKAVGFRTILFTGPRDAPADIAKDAWPPDAVVASYAEMRGLLL
jgi:putative hydrolase of the HAD superfamily